MGRREAERLVSAGEDQGPESSGRAGLTDRLVLVGFSGAGKTTVGRMLADRLGWGLIDLDLRIEEHYGTDIPTVFATHGESHFRETERSLLIGALEARQVVIVTGGGAVAKDDAWTADLLGNPGVLVVALDVEPATTHARLLAQQAADGARTGRPMLAGDDPLGRMRSLKAARQDAYDRARITIVTDGATPDAVVDDVAGALGLLDGGARTIVLPVAGAVSRITVGRGVLSSVGDRLREQWPKARRAWILTDEHVGPVYADAVAAAVEAAGLPVSTHTVPPGEGSKRLATAGACFDWLLSGGVERGDVLVALGGGVIGDLGGFVAATTLRGIGLIQVPTTLLAMVDSSVGGKTAVNHPAGKNLIGAFYQPPVVLIDPDALDSLPHREFVSGWAEIVKHAVIQRSTPGGERGDLWAYLDRNVSGLLERREPALTYLIARNVQLKAAVVEADEREAALRQILNFGHTLGHAIEAESYRYLHGEAIALGMRAAARIGREMGTCGHDLVDRLDATLDRFGLPARAEVDQERVVQLIGGDKKRTDGVQRWILPVDDGGVVIRSDVPEEAVRAALAAISAG